jgi:hypothetical protein
MMHTLGFYHEHSRYVDGKGVGGDSPTLSSDLDEVLIPLYTSHDVLPIAEIVNNAKFLSSAMRSGIECLKRNRKNSHQ